jgi:acyl carrier protein
MIFEKVKAILVKELTLGEEEVQMESSFADLGIDSLDLVELVMQLEEEFDITIEESEELKTVKNVVDYIEAKINA